MRHVRPPAMPHLRGWRRARASDRDQSRPGFAAAVRHRCPVGDRPGFPSGRHVAANRAIYCHRLEEWPSDAEIIERVPVRSCVRRGAAIDLVLDRGRENRSQIVITNARGRQMIFWQTARTRQAGPSCGDRSGGPGQRSRRPGDRGRHPRAVSVLASPTGRRRPAASRSAPAITDSIVDGRRRPRWNASRWPTSSRR